MRQETTNNKRKTINANLRAGPFAVREGTTTALRPGTLPRPCFCPAFLSSPASSAWGDPGAGRTWGCGCGTAYVSHPGRWHGLQTPSPVHGEGHHVKKPSSSSMHRVLLLSLDDLRMVIRELIHPLRCTRGGTAVCSTASRTVRVPHERVPSVNALIADCREQLRNAHDTWTGG